MSRHVLSCPFCTRSLQLHELARVRIQIVEPGHDLIQGDCACGDTLYARASDVTAEDLALCPDLELVATAQGWALAQSRDVAEVAATEPPVAVA